MGEGTDSGLEVRRERYSDGDESNNSQRQQGGGRVEMVAVRDRGPIK